ncbi:transporter substrate-binding domain-containing protein [Aurantimonas sp. Leaf443]|uniref:transporter substrate-binding domain-containing protein n=1 Tax=Aurantimonas sp. Leaf443 TaxID=1736378 RepID=UPI001FCDAC80|nr:transporter substrate-binding domain-containing protein [Aurantimonas sp. Leaf443]
MSLCVSLGGPVAPVLAQDVAVPNFFDQRQRLVKPDLAERGRVRFLTTTDFPPFNFLDARGQLAGFNVDLARAICEELQILATCQIEAMPFDDLLPALRRGEGDAIIAGLAMTPANRRETTFTEPYFRYPARFVTRRDATLAEPMVESLAGKAVAVVGGTAHAAMLRAFFPTTRAEVFPTREEGLAAMREGKVAAFFGDGVGLSFWLGSETAADCCAFSGGAYLSDLFLGEGLSIAVQPQDGDLARSFDYAIGQLVVRKRFSELMLKYFPYSPF